MEGNLVAYSDVDGLGTALSINHSPEEWPLFADSTNLRLTTVPLRNDDYLIYKDECLYVCTLYKSTFLNRSEPDFTHISPVVWKSP